MIGLISYRVQSLITQIGSRPYPPSIGPQMLDARILSLGVDTVYRDTINVVIDPTLPVPLNQLGIRFSVNPNRVV